MTTACMGGWCVKRGHCAHYHASNTNDPAERLCPPGQDGAGFQEIAHMTRPYLTAEERREQALSILNDGMSIAELREAMGYSKNENAARIMEPLVYAGRVFSARCKCDADTDSRAWTTRYWRTAEARDAFVAAKDAQIAARKKARKAEAAKRKNPERRERRRAARAALLAQRSAERAQREAMRLAEAEQRKQRARLEREAKAAEKERQKREAESQRRALRAMTKAAGQLGKQKGTASPAPAKCKGPAMVAGELDLSRARITVLPAPRGRFEVDAAPSVINSRECRAWAREAVAA